MENQKHIEAYQDLFNYLYESCGATLLQSEMDEIIDLSLEVKEKYNKASEGKKQPDTESKLNIGGVNVLLPLLILDEAEKLAMKTSYAWAAVGEEINTGDAGAFFLEGYLHAQKMLGNKR